MTTVTESVRSPYKGLSAFDDTELDALLFFGRERETEIVVANALASRLTVLYGPSGVGKSSVLRAGAVNALRRLGDTEDVAVGYFSSWSGNPIAGIEDAARGALAEAFGGDPGDAPGDLVDRLEAWTAALGGELCLVLDQFEELFLYHGEDALLDVLPELVTRPGLRVNVVLGIRDDELARLDVFKARIPGLFANYLRLDLLDRESGRAAILGPLERYASLTGERVAIEPELVETVLSQVAAGRIDPGIVGRGTVGEEDRTRIETPYLQLVLQRLWDVERERRSPLLQLATLVELGDAQRICEDHLERALTALTPFQRDVAADMFDYLVTPSGAKIAHGVSDLASFAHVEPTALEPVLQSLAHERILRPTGDDGLSGDRYEIFHDVLAGAVLAWRAGHEAEVALERERAAHRLRQRRLAIIAGISLAAFALMSALAAYAITQRSTARHEASVAQLQTAKAEHLLAVAHAATGRAVRATRAVSIQKQKYFALNKLNVKTANEEKHLRVQADTQAANLRQQEDLLRKNAAQMSATNVALTAAKGASDRHARAARASARLAATKTRLAREQTHRVLVEKQRTYRGSLLQRALAEVHANPVASVRDALAATKGGAPAGTESALRSALLATHLLASLPAGGPALAASYSTGGSQIAVANAAGGVRVFSVPGGRRTATFVAGSPLTTVAWAPGDATLAAGAHDGSVRVWDTRSKALVRTIAHGAPIIDLAYSPDGHVLATAGGQMVDLWDAATGLLLHPLMHERLVRQISFSSDGKLLLTVSNQNAAHVWDVASGDLVSTLQMRSTITSAAFGPGGTLTATASTDGSAKIWDTRSGVATETLLGHTGTIYSVAFSPTGDRVVTGSIDGTARIWSVTTGLADVIHAFTSPVLAVAFARDGQSMVGIEGTGKAIAFGSSQLEVELLGQSGPGRAASFAPDATTVATVAGSTVRLWEPYGEPRLRGIHKAADASTALAFDPTGTLLASSSTDGSVVVQKAHGGPLRTMTLGAPVLSLGWARTGVLLVGTKDGALHLRANGGMRDTRTIAHGSALIAAALRNDGAVVASVGTDGALRTWSTTTGERLIEVHPGPAVTSVALDPTGRLVAAGVGPDVVVYRAADGQVLKVLGGHTDTVTGVTFSSDGKLLASSSRDHHAIVWNAVTLGPVKTLIRHTAFVSGVAFSHDGRWLATAGPLKAGVWATGKTDLPESFLFFLRGNQKPINAVAFSPRGWEVATAARDGSVRVVDCALCGRLQNLKSYARARLRSLR